MSLPAVTQPTVAQPVHRPPTPLFASFRRKRSKIGLGVPSMSSSKHIINSAALPSQQIASLRDDENAQEKRRKAVRRIDPSQMAGGGQIVPPSPMGEGIDLNRADTLRAVSRGAPGDPQGRRVTRSKSSNQQSIGRQLYYEQAFNDRTDGSWKQKIQSESMVGAEVKTNVIIKDEFTFITNLSNQLAERFQRPVSSIAVIVQHGVCMLFGGSFDAAYMMNITAIPASLSPTMNKRNAAMIQAHMDEALGVPAARGLINFRAIPEDCTAVGGKTVAGILDEAAKLNGTSSEPSTSSESKVERRASRRISLTSFMTNLAHRNNGLTPPLSPQDAMSNLGEAPGPPGKRMQSLAEVDENTPGEPKNMMRLLNPPAPDHLRKSKSSEVLQAAADEIGTSRKKSIW